MINSDEVCIKEKEYENLKEIQKVYDIKYRENKALKEQVLLYKLVLKKIKDLLKEYKYTNIEDYSKIMEFYRKLEKLLEEIE